MRRAAAHWRAGLGSGVALLLGLGTSCSMTADETSEATGQDHAAERDRMVREQLVPRGIDDPKVLRAMRRVPRHELVPEPLRDRAYDDGALPIGMGQTISQPYVVAAMTQALGLEGGERVLEVGTGSGYQAAVLAEIAGVVWSIELEEALARRARADLERLGYENVHVRAGDGYQGWPEHAPFDAIIVTAAPEEVPPVLVEQLAVGGRMVLPVGGFWQELRVLHKGEDGITEETLFPVRFVPMRHGEDEAGPER